MSLEDFLLREREKRLASTSGRALPYDETATAKVTPRRSVTDAEVEHWRRLRAEGLSDVRIGKLVGRQQTTISRRLGSEGRVAPVLSTDPRLIRSREWWRARRRKGKS